MNIEGFMGDKELAFLRRRAADFRSWIEIGTWKGKSAFAVAQGLPQGADLYLVDTFKGDKKHINGVLKQAKDGYSVLRDFTYTLEMMRANRPDLSIHVIVDTSLNAAAMLQSVIPNSYVFVDGSHDYDSVSLDLRLYWEAAVLAGHDLRGSKNGVEKALKDAKVQYFPISGGSIWERAA